MISAKLNSDSVILQRIKDRIRWDLRVSLADLNIVVRDGTVILNGFVDSSYKKTAAMDIVSSTEGVWSVENRIVVPFDYYRTDEEIRNIMEVQLRDLIKLSGEHIEVQVVDGIVKLEGEVYRPRLKAFSAASAWELSGVRDCLNFIDIVTPPQRLPLNQNSEINNVLAFASN